jgi:nucleotide-binding universal stress UspA family protein
MPEFTRILCPIDFSVASEHAAAHAVALARWFGSSITAVHVDNPIFLPIPGLTSAGYRGEPREDEAAIRELAQRVSEVFPALAGDVPVDVRVETGPPQARIVDAAVALPADLVVMGTHGASGLEYLVLGSVTEHVLRTAPCPVLTVPPRARATSALPFTRLLVPVDFSDWSLRAVETAWRLARESDATVTLVHAIEWTVDDELRAFGRAASEADRDRAADEARRRLEALVPAGVREWCTPETRVVRGRAFRAILQTADEVKADLIVMGVHGRSPMSLAMFGSTTNQIVRRATCPVLTVRA